MRKIIVSLFCLFALSLQAQNYGSSAARKLQLAEFAIANLYVDEVDEDKIVEEAIIKMLAQLDPHSLYSNPEEVKKLNEPLLRWYRRTIQYGTRYAFCCTNNIRRTF